MSSVGGELGGHAGPGIWRRKMPIMAYFPAVKNIKTHFKNVVLTTAIPGLQPRRAVGRMNDTLCPHFPTPAVCLGPNILIWGHLLGAASLGPPPPCLPWPLSSRERQGRAKPLRPSLPITHPNSGAGERGEGRGPGTVPEPRW